MVRSCCAADARDWFFVLQLHGTVPASMTGVVPPCAAAHLAAAAAPICNKVAVVALAAVSGLAVHAPLAAGRAAESHVDRVHR